MHLKIYKNRDNLLFMAKHNYPETTKVTSDRLQIQKFRNT